MGAFLILIILFAGAWLLFVLPARRRRTSHSAMQDSIEPGDEIITAGGLHGHVKSLEDRRCSSRSRRRSSSTLDRRAVAAVARDVEVLTETEQFSENLDEKPPQPG